MRFVLFAFVILFASTLSAQDYPQNYFRNPLNIPIKLAGNFGECRANHFHSGLDIKTEQRENLPVYAAAEGYISRIKMQKGGFGHALYLAHPNGFTTLYAHLNDFAPEVQAYMKSEQYRQKSWTVDLYLPSGKFPVKKGDLIAYSGNTGGSTAPHLHFEIRNSKGHPVNPMLFGFNITDNIAPKPYSVIFYDLTKSVYEQEPIFKSVEKKGSSYMLDTVKVNTSLAGVGIDMFDYMNDSRNTLNFSTATLSMDGELQCKIKLDDIGYEITRYLHAYADHSIKKKKGRWVQQFFLLPGNRLTHIYEELNKMKGGLELTDTEPHRVEMVLNDANGNSTTISFYIKNTGEGPADDVCNGEELFKVNRGNEFTHPNVRFSLSEEDLYDDVCFTFSEKEDMSAYSARYQLHDKSVPIHTYFKLYIKPNKPIPFEQRSKVALVHNDGKDDGQAAQYDNGWYKASVREFGEYRLVVDETPPEIIPMQSREALRKSKRITFKAKEDVTSVEKFTATIDGNWVPFEQNGDIFFYTFDEHCGKGDHTVEIAATDENGNTEIVTYNFLR